MTTSKHATTAVFVGSGAIATALGNTLAMDGITTVWLLSVEEEVVASINTNHTNSSYFPNILLHPSLKATTDKAVLSTADVIFMAIPSTATIGYLKEHQSFVAEHAVLINLAKGFGPEYTLIPEAINRFMPNPVVSMKGPSFAREIINMQPTAFTVASRDIGSFEVLMDLFRGTTIYLDFSTDLKGVEYASILKNIYAIVIGIVDANFDSPNLRSMVLSKSINEMRAVIKLFGGLEETLFNYSGFGDFSLTALNDLSRNRTLGLLIGKGFFTQHISDKVVLEGRIATNVFHHLFERHEISVSDFPLMNELWKVFNGPYDIKAFVGNILKE